MPKRQKQTVDVCWNTITGKVVLTVGLCRVALSAGRAEAIAEQLLAGAEAMDVASDEDADIYSDLDQRLRAQLNSEVSAAMRMGGGSDYQAAPCPAAPATGRLPTVANIQPTAYSGRLAEELGSARETLAEILGGSPPDQGAVDGCAIATERPPGTRLRLLDRLLGGLRSASEPGKIWINHELVCLGDAVKYHAALGHFIQTQKDFTFGATLMASVETIEPPAEIPTLRPD